MATLMEEQQKPKLRELLETSIELLEEVEATTQPTGSKAIQEKVKKALKLLEKASDMLSQLDLFSRNEDWEEIASADLKYLMLPALKGALTLKLVGTSNRLHLLQDARELFMNFLTQTHNYHVAEFQLPWAQSSSQESNPAAAATSDTLERNLVAMASQRQAKIQRYKQKKAVEQRLSSLKSAVESGEADDERVREYYLLQLRRWINISLDEVDSIDQEIEILRERDSFGEASVSHGSPQERPPLKPFVLTRSVAQAQVFGAGYPSLATLTVNDWYEQRQKGEVSPSVREAERQAPPLETLTVSETEEQNLEQKEEEDENALHRMQEWDDWKDTHPRGYGNRQNMG